LKKVLKIPKGVIRNRERTDIAMVKRNRTKGQITIYKILPKKPQQNIELHEPHKTNQG
jgi:hypothetical protein